MKINAEIEHKVLNMTEDDPLLQELLLALLELETRAISNYKDPYRRTVEDVTRKGE